MINCKTYEDCVKQRVHCPICSKDYAIYSLTHVCSEILPCAFPKKTDYVERYLDNVSEGGDVPDILCEKCHFITNIATQPRKCKCPKCEYEGYYVHDETELCPACKVVIPPKKPKRVVEKVAEAVVESVPEVVKPIRSPITIFVEVKASDLHYSDKSWGDVIFDTIILRAMTNENIVSGEWGCQTRIGAMSHQEMMNEFYKYFINVASKHTISWKFNFLGRQWIEGVWNKHRPAGSIDIKFHKHSSYDITEITADNVCNGQTNSH